MARLAPTATELLQNATVRQAMSDAWYDSQPDEKDLRHEEGGWIYMCPKTGDILVRRSPPGGQAEINLNHPPLVDEFVVVGTFHTHPNPTQEGWVPGPSIEDEEFANHVGVPALIRADDRDYITGPERRIGGLSGPAGFPV